ncbi:MAG: hypothetical protein ACPGJS_23305 [Flammeovirgaceae bacterium]
MKLTRTFLLLFIGLYLLNTPLSAQNTYQNRQYQFLSFEKIPTWVAVCPAAYSFV